MTSTISGVVSLLHARKSVTAQVHEKIKVLCEQTRELTHDFDT